MFYQETFDFVFSFNTGDEVEFMGNADGTPHRNAQPLDRAHVAGDIQKQIDAQHIPGVTVQPTDQGVTITLENVNFPPNSDTLLPAEQDKLRRIAEILKKYPDRDIAVAGYTARAPGLHGGRLPEALRPARARRGELPPLHRRAAGGTDHGARHGGARPRRRQLHGGGHAE